MSRTEPRELYDLLAGAVPADPALIVGDTAWTFAELRGRVDALDAFLRARCSAGARVALLAHNRAEYLAAYYGVPRAGRILVSLNQRLHPREWLDQIARSGAELLIGEPDQLDRLRAEGTPSCRVLSFDELPWNELPWDAPPAADGRRSGPDDTAWLMFTSGTTGRPKGVRLTHRGLLAAVRVCAAGRPVKPGDVFCTPFPLCHVAGYQVMLYHLHRRPAVVLRRFDPAAVVDAVARHGVSSLSLAPTMVDSLVSHAEEHPDALRVLRAGVRVIAYGSAPMPVALMRRAAETLGCELGQGYGMTELSGNVAFLDADDHRAATYGRPELAASAGRPGPGVDIRVAAPPGGVGEVLVRAEQVTPGYWDDPDATARAFTGGWFRTGDLGRLDADGYLYLVDRLKDVIITGGENVGSREVEDVLRAVPGVRDVAVVGLPDPHWGQRVCAVVVPTGPVPPSRDDLVAACRARLAGFKAPRQIVYAADLPRTGLGKVRKDVLRERLSRERARRVSGVEGRGTRPSAKRTRRVSDP